MTHHFYLYSNGGAIDIAVKDAVDKTNIDAILAHLPRIAMLFSEYTLQTPKLVHDTKVPGTAERTKLKRNITYSYTKTPNGGPRDELICVAYALMLAALAASVSV